MIKPYKLTPKFKDVLWGGSLLKDIYNKDIPSDTTGESFEASVVENFVSSAEGILMTEIAQDKTMTGEQGFNLLFKLIDAKMPLSLQVHPDDRLAKELEGGRGKTECWYVLKAKEDAFLYLGFKDGVTKEDFKCAVSDGTLENLLSKVHVSEGDFFFVSAGTVHAIGEGILIAELQQSCDITYRVYDYKRKDKYGNERPLHTEKALLASSLAPFENSVPEKTGENRTLLASCPYFSIEKITGGKTEFETGGKYVLLFFIDKSADIVFGGKRVSAKAGDTFFIPASLGSFTVEGESCYLKMTE